MTAGESRSCPFVEPRTVRQDGVGLSVPLVRVDGLLYCLDGSEASAGAPLLGLHAVKEVWDCTFSFVVSLVRFSSYFPFLLSLFFFGERAEQEIGEFYYDGRTSHGL